MKKNKKILIIIQRSNGDVFLSASLINNLYKFYQSPEIDLLVNDDTYPLASLLPNINFIHTFFYTGYLSIVRFQSGIFGLYDSNSNNLRM